jgi:TonB family protein
MSSFSVISKKNRLRIGVAVVVVIHIGFFYGFWHVKAGRVTNEVVELDIYGNTTTDGLGYYEALPDANCLSVLNEQSETPPLQLRQSSSSTSTSSVSPTVSEATTSVPTTSFASSSQESFVPFTPQSTVHHAHSPKCKTPTPLPDGYKKLGANGFVGLEINIDKTGKVLRGDIDRTSGFADLDQAALKQVIETWIFQPCKNGDEVVACKQYIKFRWKDAQ